MTSMQDVRQPGSAGTRQPLDLCGQSPGGRAAFTLIELLVVIAIIALLVSILLPSLMQVKDLAKSAVCKVNLRGTGTAMVMYRSEHESLPFLRVRDTNGLAWTPTGTNAMGGEEQPEDLAVTSYLFLLVRQRYTTADLFSCPGDEWSQEMGKATYKSGGKTLHYWDFYDESLGDDHWRLCSYSVQTPYTNWGGVRPHESGFDEFSHPDLVILADKTPKVDTNVNWGGWQEDTPPDEWHRYISRNHADAKSFNYFSMDQSVTDAKRPDVGIEHDNIYSASDGRRLRRYGGKDGVGQHKNPTDSYLIGPVK